MTASEEAEIAGKRKPRTQPTNPPAKFLQWCAERTQKTARRSGVKFGGIIQTAREGDESTKYSQSPSADNRLHARFKNKSRKCVKNALKKHDVFVVFFSGAADQT